MGGGKCKLLFSSAPRTPVGYAPAALKERRGPEFFWVGLLSAEEPHPNPADMSP